MALLHSVLPKPDKRRDPNVPGLSKEYKSASTSLQSSAKKAPSNYKDYHNLTDFDLALNEEEERAAERQLVVQAGKVPEEGSVSFHEPRKAEVLILDDKSFAKNRSFESSSRFCPNPSVPRVPKQFLPDRRSTSPEEIRPESGTEMRNLERDLKLSKDRYSLEGESREQSEAGVKRSTGAIGTATFRNTGSKEQSEQLREDIDALNEEINVLQARINSAIRKKKDQITL